MKFGIAIITLIFSCHPLYASVPANSNLGYNLLEPKSKMIRSSSLTKPVEMKQAVRHAKKMQEFVYDELMEKMNQRGLLKHQPRTIRRMNHSSAIEGQDFKSFTLASNETDTSVKNILNRIQNNYERLQAILQNKTPDLKNSPNAVAYSNEKSTETLKERFKRSDTIVENETDVEYRKYGGYISTKIFLPLDTTEDFTNSYSKDQNDTKTGNHAAIDDEMMKNENYYEVESQVSSNTERPQPSTEDMKAFIQLMDEYAEKHTNKT